MLSTLIHYSNATETLLKDDIDKWIKHWSVYFNIEESLVRAIIKTESAFNPWAIRYEPHLPKQEWYTNTLTPSMKTNMYSYCSMGLMQVLYGVAASYGFKESPMALMEPSNAIQYGCWHLSALMKRFPVKNSAIAAYNQGNDRKSPDGKYINQQYVDKVLSNLLLVRKAEADQKASLDQSGSLP